MRPHENHLLNSIRLALWCVSLSLVLLIGFLVLLLLPSQPDVPERKPAQAASEEWHAPDSTQIPGTGEGDLLRYGRELVAHTSVYLGPVGKVSPMSNGMNCQNCHLKAGKKIWGNNFSAVASTYPKYRARSGSVEGIEKRVNDCMLRSLNGKALTTESREMKALVAYIRWVGSATPKGQTPPGAGIADLPVLERAADPKLGRAIYGLNCARCHGPNGEGARKPEGLEWVYPPLWGPNSFNMGAGLLRLSRMAGFIHRNMPNDPKSNRLSEEEAWDVAAFICSQPRPTMDLSADWPILSQKPFDHPFGPYLDAYSEQQHTYGPFGPIIARARKK